MPCNIVGLDEVLAAPGTPLMASMRYLRLLLLQCGGKEAELKKLIKMRKKRLRGDDDLEVPYHPIVLCIYQVTRLQDHDVWL